MRSGRRLLWVLSAGFVLAAIVGHFGVSRVETGGATEHATARQTAGDAPTRLSLPAESGSSRGATQLDIQGTDSVRDASGGAVRGVKVLVHGADDVLLHGAAVAAWGQAERANVATDVNGAAFLPGMGWERLRCTKEGYFPREVLLPAHCDESGDILIHLIPVLEQVAGVVVDTLGRPVPHATVLGYEHGLRWERRMIDALGAGAEYPFVTVADQDGAFVMPRPPKADQMGLVACGQGLFSLDCDQLIDLREGSQSLVIEVGFVYQLSFRICLPSGVPMVADPDYAHRPAPFLVQVGPSEAAIASTARLAPIPPGFEVIIGAPRLGADSHYSYSYLWVSEEDVNAIGPMTVTVSGGSSLLGQRDVFGHRVGLLGEPECVRLDRETGPPGFLDVRVSGIPERMGAAPIENALWIRLATQGLDSAVTSRVAIGRGYSERIALASGSYNCSFRVAVDPGDGGVWKSGPPVEILPLDTQEIEVDLSEYGWVELVPFSSPLNHAGPLQIVLLANNSVNGPLYVEFSEPPYAFPVTMGSQFRVGIRQPKGLLVEAGLEVLVDGLHKQIELREL